jgi:hypothetical protein
MICSSVYRLFFIPVLPFRLRENSSFLWLSFSGAGHTCSMAPTPDDRWSLRLEHATDAGRFHLAPWLACRRACGDVTDRSLVGSGDEDESVQRFVATCRSGCFQHSVWNRPRPQQNYVHGYKFRSGKHGGRNPEIWRAASVYIQAPVNLRACSHIIKPSV